MSASSTHPSPTDEFIPEHAIDRDQRTKWNDDSQNAYPDSLTIRVVNPITLTGIYPLSSPEGYPAEYNVEAFVGNIWITMASVTNNEDLRQLVLFSQAVTTTQIRINVTKDGRNPSGGLYTRIREVYPIYESKASANRTLSTKAPSTISSSGSNAKPSSTSSNKGVTESAVVAGLAGLAMIWITLLYLRARRKQSPI